MSKCKIKLNNCCDIDFIQGPQGPQGPKGDPGTGTGIGNIVFGVSQPTTIFASALIDGTGGNVVFQPGTSITVTKNSQGVFTIDYSSLGFVNLPYCWLTANSNDLTLGYTFLSFGTTTSIQASIFNPLTGLNVDPTTFYVVGN